MALTCMLTSIRHRLAWLRLHPTRNGRRRSMELAEPTHSFAIPTQRVELDKCRPAAQLVSAQFEYRRRLGLPTL